MVRKALLPYQNPKELAMSAKILFDASVHCADLLWVTGFFAPDPVLFVELPDGTRHLFVHELEYGRAKKQARKSVSIELIASREGENARTKLLKFLSDHHVRQVIVPATFPAADYRFLLEEHYEVDVCAPGLLYPERRIKTSQEVRWIAEAQDATDAVFSLACARLANATVRDRKILEGNDLLTSEEMRDFIELEFKRLGFDCPLRTIVASASQAAQPHECGHGPLYAHTPIVLDIFPRSAKTRYWSDMTRTVVKGKPRAAARRMYDAVYAAQELGLTMVRGGVNGKDIHTAIAEYFEGRGYETKRDKKGRPTGFFHGTGHGVGLEIHEAPRIGITDAILEKNMVVTVEPGLYYPGIGGVRIEDTVVVTAGGCRNLARSAKELLEL